MPVRSLSLEKGPRSSLGRISRARSLTYENIKQANASRGQRKLRYMCVCRFVKRRRFVRGGKSIDASGENKYRSQSSDFTEAATGITGTRAKERAKARKKRTREGCLA